MSGSSARWSSARCIAPYPPAESPISALPVRDRIVRKRASTAWNACPSIVPSSQTVEPTADLSSFDMLIIGKGAHPKGDQKRVTPADINADVETSLKEFKFDYESDGAIIFLSCVARSNPELSPEVWPVTYWGQTHRRDMFEYVHANPGMHTWDWRCRRQRNSVTCWAVN